MPIWLGDKPRGSVALGALGTGGGYVLPTPILLESFDSLTGISTSNGFSALDAVNKIQGTNAINMIGNGVAFANPRLDKSLAISDPAAMGTIAFRAHVEADYNQNSLNLQFGDASTLTAGVSMSFGSGAVDQDVWYAVHVSELTEIGTTILGALTRWRLTQTPNNPMSSRVSVDCMMRNAGGRPTIVLTGDDCPVSQYTVAYPYMRDRGIPFHLNLPSSNVGGGGGSNLTWAQCQEMHASGLVDFGPNNTVDDQSAVTKHASVAAAVADYEACRAAIIAGMGYTPRGIDFGCYSNGDFAVSTTKSQVAAMTQTSGSADVSFGAAPTRAVAVGDTVEVYGDLLGATVTAVTDTTHVTLSRAATTTQTKLAAFNDRSGAFYFGKYPAALAAVGSKMMRSTGGIQWYTRYGFGSRAMTYPSNSTSSTAGSFATLKALIDTAVLRGTTIGIYFHGIGSGAPLPWGGDDGTHFRNTIDYLVSLRNAGLLDILTPRQLWDRDAGGLSKLPF